MLYIDALRGVTMLLVVYHHVVGMCIEGLPVVDRVVQSFRMPVFFFVSGLVAYKALDYWTAANTGRRLVKKVRSQVIPTVIFFSLYYYLLRDIQPHLLWWDYGWKQFWFTMVLFEFFVVYFTVNYLTRRSEIGNIATLLAVVVASMAVFNYCKFEGRLYTLTEALKFCQYLSFFVCGTLARRYYDTVIKWIDHWWVVGVLAVLFALQVPALFKIYPLPVPIYNFVVLWSIRVTGLLLVFSFFVKIRECFTATGRVTRVLTLVGSRTLDIYLMHYFFISELFHWYRALEPHMDVWMGHAFIVGYTVLVVLACLLVGGILRKSRLLGNILFAAK